MERLSPPRRPGIPSSFSEISSILRRDDEGARPPPGGTGAARAGGGTGYAGTAVRAAGPGKPPPINSLSCGAEERTRTSTGLRPHGPEPCASASSATSAYWRLYHCDLLLFYKFKRGVNAWEVITTKNASISTNITIKKVKNIRNGTK